MHNSKLDSLDLLSKFSHQKIAVIGDIMLDKYLYGQVDRISPEAPIPIVKVTSEKYTPGGAANVAANISTLGGVPYLFGIVGDDHNSKVLVDLIKKFKISSSGIIREASKKTICKTRVVSLNQQLIRIDHEDTEYIEKHFAEHVLEQLAKISDLSVIIISDYAKGTITEELMQEIIKFSKTNNVSIIVDPKPKHMNWYKNTFIITPNKKEAEVMSNSSLGIKRSFFSAGKNLSEDLCANIIITAGSDGMYIIGKDVEPLQIPTRAKEVFDVSGAGDTVVAALALSIGSGASICEAAEIANLAAGVKVGKVGTQPVYWKEIKLET